MMNNNKILTVSYGTFSCTLEGFEDSFGTMKAIAEYFRDLAADDRYFGAEPPQPDAEMLARIAQKEVARRVEAREQDGTIVLSALEDGANAAPAAEAAPAAVAEAAPVAEAVAPAPVVDAPVVADVPAPAEEAAEEIAVEEPIAQEEPIEEEARVSTESATVASSDVDHIAAEQAAAEVALADAPAAEVVVEADDADDQPEIVLSTDETAVEEDDVSIDLAAIQTALADGPAEEEPVAAEEVAEEEIAAPVEAIEEAPAEEIEEEHDIVPGQPDADVEAFFAQGTDAPEVHEDAFEELTVEDVPVAEEAPAASAATNDIAAKLQRIRAVVARHEESDDEDDYLEDEHAETKASPAVARSAALLDEARDEIEEALDADEVAEVATDDSADDVASILSRLESEVPVADADPILEDTAEDTDEDAENLFEPEAEAPKAPAAQVIRVKRADLETALDEGDVEEIEEEVAEVEGSAPRTLDDLAPSKRDKTALSPEDEAELARELTALEADIAADNAEAEAPVEEVAEIEEVSAVADTVAEPVAEVEDTPVAETANDAAEVKDSAPGRDRLPTLDEDADGDMNRLLAETDQQLDEPESTDRRNAFSHLRAAVAAKKADASMDEEEALRKADNAYRDDLAEVVRPRRPKAKEGRSSRPAEGRPAPLKLVAEQRIDVEQPKASGPVQPRRVAAMADMQVEGDGDSFAQFAEEMGATTLPQLLEAAAAYLSFVEGREQFSRPQLMTKVRQAGREAGFSREEGLRSFGQLLRTGKIEKIKGGRFTVSEDIGFRPDERAAG